MKLSIDKKQIIPGTLNTIQWLMVVSFFFFNRIEFLITGITFVLLLRYTRGRLLKSHILTYMLLIFGISALMVTLVGYTYGKFLQQAFIITITYLIEEQLFLHNKAYLKEVFCKFIKFSYYVSIIGLLQEAIWLVAHIDISYALDMQWLTGVPGMHVLNGPLIRVRVFNLEGGGLGPQLVPTLFYIIYYDDCYGLLQTKWKKLTVILCAILTLSPVPYLVMAVAVYLRAVKAVPQIKTVSLIAGVCLAIFGFVKLQQSESTSQDMTGLTGIVTRLRDTAQQIGRIDSRDATLQGNASTAVLMCNLYSAIHAPSRLLGTGIGTNPQNYQASYGFYANDENAGVTSLNNEDAYCLGIRLFSEVGVVGYLLFILFLYKHTNKQNPINICMLCWILPCLFKGGQYVAWGMQFNLFLLYFSYKMNPTQYAINVKPHEKSKEYCNRS